MDKRLMKRVAVVTSGGLLLGCIPSCPCFPCGKLCNWLPAVVTTVAGEFLLDNDAVFDLFQDDFGTGTQYDDRFTADPIREEPDEDTQALVDNLANR